MKHPTLSQSRSVVGSTPVGYFQILLFAASPVSFDLMTKISTAHILADKALQESCGQNCVDWAITMLEQGHDGHNLMMLAGMLPPYNHFEIAALRDRALHELRIGDLDPSVAIRTFAVERLRLALA